MQKKPKTLVINQNLFCSCWRKQLMIAKDTRRVDILCYRVSLSQKLLSGTKKYLKLYEIMDTAAKKLEAEVGPVAGLPVKMARSIVNRLSSGPEVQKMCAFAVESLESMLSCSILHPPPNDKIQESSFISSNLIRFEDVCPTSLTVVLDSEDASLEELVGYTLWHCKADVMDYPAEPTCTLFKPNARFLVSDLTPGTEYLFKVVSFCGRSELGMREIKFTTIGARKNALKSLVIERSIRATNCSSLSNRSSEGDESNNPTGKCSSYWKRTDKTDLGRLCDDIKDISDARNTSTGSGQEGSPGDSLSVLDDEHVMGEAMIKSTIQTESQKDSTNSTNGDQVFDTLKAEKKHSEEGQLVEEISTDNGSNTLVRKDMEVVPFVHSSDPILPFTSCKLEIGKEGLGIPCEEELEDGSGKAEEPQVGSSTKKKRAGWDKGCLRDGSLEREYEYCVKVIRMLECEEHIEKNFRVKFLTWYSLRATPQERRIVKVFVDTLIDDPACLAGQLIDTFLEGISIKRPPAVPTGLCMKLWH
ncbi:hypothetical protein HHK36_026057 [Tetracentron sinense]|uniref:Fibronectin type-III domain-containing protein n=1 Tax=Tetracentron sinense TaxID=13715 RepID=A0A834YMP4_TETSI|nr:hypothetical protein HHK36_026057 [Tetracentron sinense]